MHLSQKYLIRFCGKKLCTDQEFFNSMKIENLFKTAVPGSNVTHIL